MALESVLMMLGGIGLFLYGMKLMSTSLEQTAGAKMERILERLTSNKAKGVALGAGVTAVIQSSAATIIMVVGFLNAGIMKLVQAVPVIMGANIGTTITAQILRLGDISGDNIILTMLKPSSFAPILIIIGAFVLLLAKRKSLKNRISIILGLGILFMGMTLMESAFEPLAESPEFSKVFTIFEHPLIGIAVGMMVTILLQSSSASVGVLQATASTGVVTFAMAAPLVIGANLGKCVTVLLASIGVNKDAKRAVTIDITMCVLGSALFMVAIYAYQHLVGFSFWHEAVNRGGIADFHTLFNIVVAVVMLPLMGVLIKISKRVVKDKAEDSMIDQQRTILDPRFLETPGVALTQAQRSVSLMYDAVQENFKRANKLIRSFDEDTRDELLETEEFLDKSEALLGEFILKINDRNLTGKQSLWATELLHTVGDLERIGDHCDNLAEDAEIMKNTEIQYSEKSLVELDFLTEAIEGILDMTQETYEQANAMASLKIDALEDTVDKMVETLKSNHMDRLKNGECTVERGVFFIEILNDMERIADHCVNISTHLVQRLNGKELNVHEHDSDKSYITDEYIALCEFYDKRYLAPLLDQTEGFQQLSFDDLKDE